MRMKDLERAVSFFLMKKTLENNTLPILHINNLKMNNTPESTDVSDLFDPQVPVHKRSFNEAAIQLIVLAQLAHKISWNGEAGDLIKEAAKLSVFEKTGRKDIGTLVRRNLIPFTAEMKKLGLKIVRV